MAPSDPNSLLREAEAHFVAGRAAAARPLVERVLRVVPGHPAVLHLHGLILGRLDELAAARQALEAAERGLPGDPQVANNLGNLLGRLGASDAALAAYDRAIAAAPGFAPAHLNRAITLDELGRPHEARAAFAALFRLAPPDASALAAAAAAERNAGDLPAAAALLDRALALDPAHPLATRTRARVALDLGEADAVTRHARARAAFPDDRDLLLDALDGAQTAEARQALLDRIATLLRNDPGWHAGHRTLAAARFEDGAQGHADSFEAAHKRRPKDAQLWRDHVAARAKADDFAGAAEVCLRAERAVRDPAFAAAAFVHLSAAGDIAAADTLLARLPPGLPGPLALAKHHLRGGDPTAAEPLLAAATAAAPGDIEAWALRGIAWELLDDPRAEWLNGQPGLVAVAELPVDAAGIESIAGHLRTLHAASRMRLGQSVRGGTQTQGDLFHRQDPEVARLRRLIGDAVERHRAGLPPADPDHPLLRHRDAPLGIAGAWSIRLTEGGFHVRHMHPRGLFSAASYWAVPPVRPDDPHAGWLEIGGAPAYLALDLAPRHIVQPQPGRLVLFPSTLHHGTRPFPAGERISVAFDVVTR